MNLDINLITTFLDDLKFHQHVPPSSAGVLVDRDNFSFIIIVRVEVSFSTRKESIKSMSYFPFFV